VDEQPKRSLFRVAKAFPPGDDEYLSPQDKGRKQPASLTTEQRRSWDALSFWDSEAGARRVGQDFPKAGAFIVRYDIPENSGIRYEQTLEPGHYDLRGDKDELERCLVPDFCENV